MYSSYGHDHNPFQIFKEAAQQNVQHQEPTMAEKIASSPYALQGYNEVMAEYQQKLAEDAKAGKRPGDKKPDAGNVGGAAESVPTRDGTANNSWLNRRPAPPAGAGFSR